MDEFDGYREEIERLIRARYWRVPDVEDLVSEAWIGAWAALSKSRHPARRLVARKAALWSAMHYLRQGRASLARGQVQVLSLNDELDLDGEEEDPSAEVIRRVDARQQARLALAALTEHQRRVVRLRYWNDLDNAQIAERLGIRRDAVATLISQSLGWCRRALAGERVRRRANKGQSHCVFGHELNEANRWVTKHGTWQCRICRNERHRRFREKQRG